MQYVKLGSYKSAVSDAEMERRWRITQEEMVKNDIDCLLLYANDGWQAGAIRYFTDWPPENMFGYVVLFPQEGKPALFGHGQYGESAIPSDAARELDINVALPFAPALPYTDDLIPLEAVAYLKKRGYKHIGLYRKLLTPFHLVNYIRENLKGAEFIDVDDMVDTIKAVKSEEELEALKDAVRIHDELCAAMPLFLRPGRYEYEVAADVKKAALDLGCEFLNIMIGSGRPCPGHFPPQLQYEVLREGDAFDILFECSNTGGYFAELCRMFSLGEPSDDLVRAVDASIRLQELVASQIKPGVKAEEMRVIAHKFQELNGYDKENRLLGHGQGVGLVERPAYVYGERMEFRENMFLSIHPGCRTKTINANISDNYVVTKDGAVRLSKAPLKLIVCA